MRGKKVEINPGDEFNQLTVISEVARRNGVRRFLCQCDCGGQIVAWMSNLRKGLTKSCGHCQKRLLIKHGMSLSPEYKDWASMIQKCTNPNCLSFSRFGGRGITVCDRWLEFENFYSDMGSKPVGYRLNRIDENLGYSPENCKWISPNFIAPKLITVGSVTLTPSQWASKLGMDRDTLINRLRLGWTPEDAILTPVRKLTK